MPDIKISKLKTRRGPENQRKNVIFDQGEIVSTTDTQRLFLGDGATAGGISVTCKIHDPVVSDALLTSINAQKGDLVLANNIFYQLTGTNPTVAGDWGNVGPKIDSTFFNFTASNAISLKTNSLSAVYLDPNTIGDGLIIDSDLLKINYNSTQFELSGSKFSLTSSGVTEREISSTSFGNGISGGSGDLVSLKVHPNDFYFDSGTLRLSTTPFSVSFSDLKDYWFTNGIKYNSIDSIIELDPTVFGSGLIYDSNYPLLSTVLTNIDNDSLVKTDSGVISISSNTSLSGSAPWASITVDKFGKVVNKQSTIVSVLTGDSALSGYNVESPLSGIFNGDPLGLYNLNVAQFTALSSNGQVLTLSSAGFITFDGHTSRDGQGIGRFAIPIFRY